MNESPGAIVAPPPMGLLAELTHRCPLKCPYCSNPLELDRKSQELDTTTWMRVLSEAARMGVLHVHLSGGEPTARGDIVDLTAHCAREGLYTNLITSGIGPAHKTVAALAREGLDHVQLSIQAADPRNAERIASLADAHAQKLAFGECVVALGLPLTVNAVIHRGNIDEVDSIIDLAVAMKARRLEIAHAQYYGWALANRAALMPGRDAVKRSVAVVAAARKRLAGQLVIDLVLPDYYAKYPKACAGGWGRRQVNITPSGKVLPCHAAETLPGLEFWSVRDRSLQEIWTASPAFNSYRGTDWMPEPCRSCSRKTQDWGGCRCQAFALAGNASATDPACMLSSMHNEIGAIAEAEAHAGLTAGYLYRMMGVKPASAG